MLHTHATSVNSTFCDTDPQPPQVCPAPPKYTTTITQCLHAFINSQRTEADHESHLGTFRAPCSWTRVTGSNPGSRMKLLHCKSSQKSEERYHYMFELLACGGKPATSRSRCHVHVRRIWVPKLLNKLQLGFPPSDRSMAKLLTFFSTTAVHATAV